MAVYDSGRYGPLEPYYPRGMAGRAQAAVGVLAVVVWAAFFGLDLTSPGGQPWFLWPVAGAFRLAGVAGVVLLSLLFLLLGVLPWLGKRDRPSLLQKGRLSAVLALIILLFLSAVGAGWIGA